MQTDGRTFPPGICAPSLFLGPEWEWTIRNSHSCVQMAGGDVTGTSLSPTDPPHPLLVDHLHIYLMLFQESPFATLFMFRMCSVEFSLLLLLCVVMSQLKDWSSRTTAWQVGWGGWGHTHCYSLIFFFFCFGLFSPSASGCHNSSDSLLLLPSHLFWNAGGKINMISDAIGVVALHKSRLYGSGVQNKRTL